MDSAPMQQMSLHETSTCNTVVLQSKAENSSVIPLSHRLFEAKSKCVIDRSPESAFLFISLLVFG